MTDKAWQIYDKLWKYICEHHSDAVLRWLDYEPTDLKEKVRVEILRTEARAPDSVFILDTKPEKTVLIIECELELNEGMEGRVLTAFGAALKKFGPAQVDIVVIGLTGTRIGGFHQDGLHTQLFLKYRTIALETLDAAAWSETKSSNLLPFVSLMKGCDVALLERTALKILERGPSPETRSSLENLLTLAGIRFSTEVIMSLGNLINRENTYLQLKKKADDALVQKGLEKGLEEGLEKGLGQGQILALREALLRQLQRKFPTIKTATIRSRLRRIKDLTRLQLLSDRILDDLAWKDFWAA